MKMTSQEAFVETLRVNGVKVAFGIVGSAFMPGLDVFERAGIRFVDVAHEQGAAHMADTADEFAAWNGPLLDDPRTERALILCDLAEVSYLQGHHQDAQDTVARVLALDLSREEAFDAAALLVGAFAIFHGYAHGTELPAAANPLAYSIGFVVTTGLLHLAGIAFGLLAKWPAGCIIVRAGGALISAVGVSFLVA